MTGPVFTDADFAAFLKDISEPFTTRDISNWRARIQLPFSVVTAAGPVTMTTEAEVQQNYDLYLDASDAMGLDFVHRDPMSIEHCEDGTVLATYRTHLLRSGTRVADPYTSTALMHHHPEGWKMSAILNARGHHSWTGIHPHTSGE
jgi:hypothetical protein